MEVVAVVLGVSAELLAGGPVRQVITFRAPEGPEVLARSRTLGWVPWNDDHRGHTGQCQKGQDCR